MLTACINKLQTVEVSSVTISPKSLILVEGRTEILTAAVFPDDATDKTVTWGTTDANVVTVDNGTVTAVGKGKAIVTATAGEHTAICSVSVNEQMTGIIKVDLGLPSGLKWANVNLGASAPELFGDYYAWGEPEPYYEPEYSYDSPCFKWKEGKTNGYVWESYGWLNVANNQLTKYCTNSNFGTVDNKVTLELTDDAAHAKLGGTWRIPTAEEWRELKDNCSWEYTMQNGIYGALVTGPNKSSIFLPATGDWYETHLQHSMTGHYWSSTLSNMYANGLCILAVYLKIDNSGAFIYDANRCIGFTIRPVSE